MTLVLGKDFKVELGYVPRVSHSSDEFVFLPVGDNVLAESRRKANEILIEAGHGDMLVATNKPGYTQGLWVSPCNGDFSAWGGACVSLDFKDDYASFYHKVTPHGDCRIFVMESLNDYLELEKYDFRWDLIAKDYDMVYVNTYDVMDVMFGLRADVIKPKYDLMMYGWDCISGVFLNYKFDIEFESRHIFDSEKSELTYTDIGV